MTILLGLLIVVALTAATGFFVAQEFAYVAADRARLHHMAEGGDRAARRALRVMGRLSFTLSGAQLGITVTALLVGYFGQPYLGAGLARLLGRSGLPATASFPLAVAVALAFATGVQMVFGELAPKNLAIARPEALARALSRATLAYLAVAGPLIKVFDAAANRLLRLVGIKPADEPPQGATSRELHHIIAEARARGQLDEELSRLLDRGLEFRALTAEQVMTPRVDVHTLRADEPAARVVALLDTGHSRFPVVRDGLDDVVGVVGVAEVLGLPPAERARTPVGAIAAPPLLVPTGLALPALLERLRAERRQLACVVDEFGGFAGVVSFEDVAEEVVGDIRDEDDPAEDEAARRPDGSWLVPARWRIDEVTAATGITLPQADGYDTLSGLVMDRLGRTPQPGDEVEVTAPLGGGVERPRVRLTVVTVYRRVPQAVAVRASGGVSP